MGPGFLQFRRIRALALLEFTYCSLEAISVALLGGSAGGAQGSAVLSLLQWCTEGPSGFCRGGLFLRSLFKASATRWSPAHSQTICARSSASWSPLR